MKRGFVRVGISVRTAKSGITYGGRLGQLEEYRRQHGRDEVMWTKPCKGTKNRCKIKVLIQCSLMKT